MNRFHLVSFLLHLGLFTVIASSSRNIKPIPKFEVYKVSLTPLPQPRIMTTPEPVVEETKKEELKKTEEKAPPKEQKETKKERVSSKKASEAKPKKTRLPDIKPKIYTGSGQGFTYSYYLNILLNKIGQNWHNPYKNKDVVLKSIIYFEVDKNGNISRVRIEEDSGDEVYNESTLRAVTLTKKLPPLPQEFSNDYLKVHLEFLTAQ